MTTIRRLLQSPAMTPIALMAVAGASACSASAPTPAPQTPRWGMAIHTGAGAFTLASIKESQAPMRAAMAEALAAGHRILSGGGSSVDAVEAAVVILEDSPFFNAGKGAVFTHEGTNELDASIMDGATMMAGAAAGLKRVKNPIRLARRVMERSSHVMMVAEGAEAFAREQGIEIVPESYFRTELRWQQLQRALEREKTQRGATARPPVGDPDADAYFGTVGAVALDRRGSLAAATSTGGVTNKRFGRVGDSPIIGAGTYANNRSCAISSTGVGEYFIRFTVAHDICARVEYSGVPAQEAADAVVHDVLKHAGGEGGVVGLDRLGHVVMSFNTSGMGRGYVGEDGKAVIMFTADDAAGKP